MSSYLADRYGLQAPALPLRRGRRTKTMSDGMTDNRSQPDEAPAFVAVTPGMGANDRQVGGAHYNKGSAIQHWDFVVDHKIGYLEGCASKYLVRWRQKNGLQDLEKAKHFTEKTIEKAMMGKYWPISTATPCQAEAWCLENKVDMVESRAIVNLFTWQRTNDKENPVPARLEAALQFIDVLIYKAREEERVAKAIVVTEEERKELHRTQFHEDLGLVGQGFVLGSSDLGMPKYFSDTLHPGVTAVAYKGARVRVKGHHPEVKGQEGHVQDIYDKGLWLLVKFDDKTLYPHGYQCQYGDLVILDALDPQPLKA